MCIITQEMTLSKTAPLDENTPSDSKGDTVPVDSLSRDRRCQQQSTHIPLSLSLHSLQSWAMNTVMTDN